MENHQDDDNPGIARSAYDYAFEFGRSPPEITHEFARPNIYHEHLQKNSGDALYDALHGLKSWAEVPDKRAIYECMFRGRRAPPVKFLSIKRFVTKVDSRRQHIFEQYTLLREIWSRHWWTIRKRWHKKSTTQRQLILEQAWGGKMSSRRRPDLRPFLESLYNEGWYDQDSQRDAILWPLINLEDLQNPRNLMVFMHTRATHTPVEFSDIELVKLLCEARSLLAFEDVEQSYLMMLFRKGCSEQDYAKVIDVRREARALEWDDNGEVEDAARGLLVLEIQEKIWTFLASCARAILHDLPGQLIMKALPCDPFPSPTDDLVCTSWAEMAELTPYKGPRSIDLNKITRLLRAERDAYFDHYWTLREDPGYFTETAMSYYVHHQLPGKKQRLGKSWWQATTTGTMWKGFMELWGWSHLYETSVGLQRKHGDQPGAEQLLEEHGSQGMYWFKILLERHLRGMVEGLSQACERSPIVSPFIEKANRRYGTNAKKLKQPDMDMVALLIYILRLQCPDDKPENFLHSALIAVAEAQRFADTHSGTLQCMSSDIAMRLAEIATIAVPVAEVGLFMQSLPGKFPSIMEMYDRYSDCEYSRQMAVGIPEAIISLTKGMHIHVERCGNDASWFVYPNDRPRSRERVQQMRLSEERLDSLWSHFDDCVRQHDIQPPSDLVRLPADRQATPPWRDEEERGLRLDQRLQPPTQDVEELYWDLHISTERTIGSTSRVQHGKAKLKTRGTGDQTRSSEEHSTTNDVKVLASQPDKSADAGRILSDPLSIPVNARALKTFNAFFFTPSLAATPGEIPWKDFLHAMYSAGFRAEKMYGSAWKFDPIDSLSADGASSVDGQTTPSETSSASTTSATSDKTSVTTSSSAIDGPASTTRSSIIFHEPHPSNKIPYVIARRHGRRLARAYGWSGETFVLAEKEKAAPSSQKEKEKAKK
jgi:hypothetical protein